MVGHEMSLVQQPEAGRRIRAARILAGIKSVPDLEEKIAGRGFKRTRLYALEQGHGELQRPVAVVIAAACALPVEFFEVDFQRLPELVMTPEEAERRLQRRLQEDAERERRRKQDDPEADDEPGQEGQEP